MSDAESSLRKLLGDIADKREIKNPNIEIKGFSSGGANYTSAIFFATIMSPNTKELSLFAKVATMGEKIRNRPHVDRIFTIEQLFYNKLRVTWDGFQEKYCVPEEDRYIFPEFYGGSATYGAETVVLENLSEKGYAAYNRFKSIDWEYASKAVEVMAKFHAFSFVHEKEIPDDYKKLTEDLVFEISHDEQQVEQIWQKIIQSSIHVLREDLRSKLTKFLDETDRKAFYRFYCPHGKPILVHGDYRPSNLMFKRENDSIQVIPVDYQTVRVGTPVTDLIYFTFMGSDKEFRDNHYPQIIEHYYEQLTLALSRFKIEVAEVYPRERFDREYKEFVPFAALLGLFVLPVITVEAENAPRMDGDSDFENFIVKPNELYAQRFNDLIEDCYRYEIL